MDVSQKTLKFFLIVYTTKKKTEVDSSIKVMSFGYKLVVFY